MCELIGGATEAKRAVLAAIAAGKHVVTANKALLAEHGDELFAAADAAGVEIYYEAAVCGGVPIIRVLREGLASDRVEALAAIVNGTSNYILTDDDRDAPPVRRHPARGAGDGLRRGRSDARRRRRRRRAQARVLVPLCFGTRIDVTTDPVDGIARIEPIDFATPSASATSSSRW